MPGTPPSITSLRKAKVLLDRLAAIGLVPGAIGGSFVYAAGWLNLSRLIPERIVDALSARGATR